MAELKLFGSLDPRIELDRLRLRELNFEPLDLPRLRNDPAWRVDHYGITLPPERPGDPVDGGSWSVARQLCALYEFVDPAIVRAYYHPDDPVEGRTMLLEIIFWGFRIYAGVRVGGEFDGLRAEDGRHARVWAWNYQTLRGHFERGRVDYEVWKWLDTGEVEFRLDTVSSAAEQGNFVVRLGFRLFGRRKQIQFAHQACRRMARLTRMSLEGGVDLGPSMTDGGLAVRPDPRRDRPSA
ncbi:hypothetical protein BH20ACT23_BH20ACT23_16560 [soil metagenome]